MNKEKKEVANEQKENKVKSLVIIEKEQNEINQGSQVEELKREVERLNNILSLKKEPDNIEDKIKYFEKKKDLIVKREKMDIYINNLNSVYETICKEAQEDIFSSEIFNINITKKTNYRDDDIIKISNPVLIAELIEFLISKSEAKRKNIELEINA